ncbi:MAG: coenzyme-B sulfoethylthiotransferase subunit alpha [Candidatus Methanofastidiosa archaeon]|nr:coenzyme-B sulfoethylthiotransferase subunit alpha [Candidatus Methanofastidiosa archaeon]
MVYKDAKHNFMQAMKKKFEEAPDKRQTKYYVYGGYKQNKRKVEFHDAGQQIAKERGIPGYNPSVGMPQGQRVLMPYQLSHTDIIANMDDLHFVNNAAMQQAWDDMRRTILVGLDSPHNILEKRLGKEVTPETINHYLEVVNHAMPGAAVIQEHMVETDPRLVKDSYVKVYSGNDELIDEIDSRFVIDINKEFPADQAASLKKAIGKSMWQVVRIPTVVGRICDGGTVSRWSAMQIGMAFIGAYNLCAGEAATGDFAYAAKHGSVIQMSDMMPARRARGPNEPGGLMYGIVSDCAQSMAKYPDDPARHALEAIALAALIYDQIYLGSYMSGGVGFTQYATAAYTDNILEDFVYWGMEHVKDKYGDLAKQKPSVKLINDIGTDVAMYCLEQYELYPAVMETHFGGSQRATCISAAAGTSVSMATGNAQAGLSAWYLACNIHKEQMGRFGFYGYDLQDQIGASNTFSYRSDEGLPFELRGGNYPSYAMNVGHQSAYTGIVAAAHSARGDAWALSPHIKVAFADRSLPFDFANITKEFGRGAMREFVPAGERDLIIP